MERNSMDGNKRIWLLAIGLAALVAAVLVWRIGASSDASRGELSVYQLAWFSTDDGKTWFRDDAGKLPPFDKDGKPAYRAYLYRKSGQPPFALFLERYTPEAVKQLNDLKRQTDHPPEIGIRDRIIASGVEVKKPGDKEWVKASDPRSNDIMRPRITPTDNTTLEAVLP